MKGEQITTTKDGGKSSNSEINDYLIPIQMVLYAKNSDILTRSRKFSYYVGTPQQLRRE
jgi:hypothetical protein